MSTRSCIALERCNGQVDEIYCHSDGYIKGVGATLLTHYTSVRKLSALIRLGDISSLGETPARIHTTAYSRCRGEPLEDVRHRTTHSVQAFKRKYNDSELRNQWGYEYLYLLTRRAGWLVKQYDGPWEPLNPILMTETLVNEEV